MEIENRSNNCCKQKYAVDVKISGWKYEKHISEEHLGVSVKGPTLGFGSGRGLGIVRSSPGLGFALGGESAWDSLPLPHSPLRCVHVLSQIN